MFQAKLVENIKTHILQSVTFLKKFCHLWDSVEIWGRAGLSTDDNIIRYMCFACWVTEATDTHTHTHTRTHTRTRAHTHTHAHTHIICNTYCFSTSTVVAYCMYIDCLVWSQVWYWMSWPTWLLQDQVYFFAWS